MFANKVLSKSPGLVTGKRCGLGFVSETQLAAPFSPKASDGVPSASASGEPAKPLHWQRRNFSSGAASPPRQPPPSALAAPGTDYISLFQPTYTLTGIGTFTPGSGLKGYPLPQNVLKEDIIRHSEMSNLRSENVKIIYNSVFRPKYVQFEVDSAATQSQITKCLQERGQLGYRIMKAEVSPAMHWTVVDAALKDSPRGRMWHKLSSNGVGISSRHRKCEVFRTQALKFSSVASPVSEKDGNSDSSVEETCVSGDEKVEHVSEAKDEPAMKIDKEQAAKAEQEDKEALLNSIAQLEALLSEKNSQLVELKERAVTTKAELENVKTRAQREADNTKKYAIQEFARSLLDVADNLGRALMTIPANVRKELFTDQSDTGKLLKSLVEGLIMTERELMKVLKKFGVEKFEPVGQQFDPNSHLALFEVADPSKEPGTVALVAKVGYMLHDRVLRPAEVGVIKSLE